MHMIKISFKGEEFYHKALWSKDQPQLSLSAGIQYKHSSIGAIQELLFITDN